MTAPTPALPLPRERELVGAYLRSLRIPYESLAGEIIARHLAPASDLLAAALVLWACDASGGDPSHAVPTAAAVELFRRSEVLRDELLAGQPASGLGQCLNAGDALNAIAYRALVEGPAGPARLLRSSAIVTSAFVEGIERRNGAILWAGLEAGAVLGGASERLARRLRRAGRLLAAAASGSRPREYVAKAVAAVERSGVDGAHAGRFAEVARYVAAQAA
jgi:hypothetical protein